MRNDWSTWLAAAAQPDVDAAMRALYADLDAVIAARNPVCNQSGRCCKFDSFGHRLYVTALEVAWFVRQAGSANAERGSEETAKRGGLPILNSRLPSSDFRLLPSCPYQIDNLCSAHAIRPLGCRIFFCEQGTADWQHQVYEDFLTRLKAIHTRFAVPYQYLEWRIALDEVRAAPTPPPCKPPNALHRAVQEPGDIPTRRTQ